MGPIASEIDRRLRAALSPQRLEIVDDSAKHRGHAGHNPQGESHFSVRVVSNSFTGLSRVERQRLVYGALGELMDARVHALSIVTQTPAEVGQQA